VSAKYPWNNLGQQEDGICAGRLTAECELSYPALLTTLSYPAKVHALLAELLAAGRGIGLVVGAGSPEGVVNGQVGDVYSSSTGDGVYYKASGADTNTGWLRLLTGTGGFFVPSNGIYGTVKTSGDATHPAFIQLLNPSGPNKKMKIYELAVSIPNEGNAGQIRVRSVTGPTSLGGGTNNNGVPFRLDETDVTAIGATLIGNSNLGAIISQANAEWEGGAAQEAIAGWQPTYIRAPGSFPWTLAPGSAIEISTDVAGTNRAVRAYAVWDEVA
jgi:hypothetical protein